MTRRVALDCAHRLVNAVHLKVRCRPEAAASHREITSLEKSTGWVGPITKVGDSETRTALFEAANVILRPTTRWSSMNASAMKMPIDRVPDVRRSPWPDEWQSPFTACGLTNRISVGRQLRLSCPRNSERSMQGQVRMICRCRFPSTPKSFEPIGPRDTIMPAAACRPRTEAKNLHRTSRLEWRTPNTEADHRGPARA